MTFPNLTIWQTAGMKISAVRGNLGSPVNSGVLDFPCNRSRRRTYDSAGEHGGTTIDRARDGVQDSPGSRPAGHFVTIVPTVSNLA